MAIHYKTFGLALSASDIREADQLFLVYTKDYGKIKVLGRGIRKITSKLRSGIDLFCFCELEFIRGKYYLTLTDARIISELNLKDSLYDISSVIERATGAEESDARIWRLLVNLSKYNFNDKFLYSFFFWNLMFFSGYSVDLKSCVHCSARLSLAMKFDFDAGGIVCSN